MPHVSLIIPIYNADPFLARCLQSAAAQTEPELEIICVDDASTDGSRAILAAYACRDSRFRVVHRESNGGESAARNQGVALARGEYLAFLDHDDMLAADACSRLYAAAKEHEADIAKGRVKICGYDGRIHASPLELHAEITQTSKFHFLVQWWSALYRREMIQGTHFFAEGYPLGADCLFLTDALIAAKKITCIDDLVYTYFRSPESGDSRVLSHAKIASVTKMHLEILAHLHAANIPDTDRAGYMILAWNCFKRGLNYIPRCIGARSRALCCEYISAVMALHRFPDELKSSVKDEYPVLFPLLYGDDFQNFKLLAVDQPEKYKSSLGLMAKLRYGLRQKLVKRDNA